MQHAFKLAECCTFIHFYSRKIKSFHNSRITNTFSLQIHPIIFMRAKASAVKKNFDLNEKKTAHFFSFAIAKPRFASLLFSVDGETRTGIRRSTNLG
jgi:hypothetical protein